jgi:hypothetical protein
LEDQYGGGKRHKLYCNKGDSLFVLSFSKPVYIVFGKHGAFPILISQTKEIMISTPEILIEKIREVDSRMPYGFPIEFVKAISESKGSEFQNEFAQKLKVSSVRESLKNEILEKL